MRLVDLPDEDATLTLGGALAIGLRASGAVAGGLVVLLLGDLGAGKTTLVRGLLRGLGHIGPVRSPTYTLVEPYVVPGLAAYHFDLYRLNDPEELEYLGARDYFAPGQLCLIEWPTRAAGHLPPADLHCELGFFGAGRQARLSARSPAGRRWMKALDYHMPRTAPGAGTGAPECWS